MKTALVLMIVLAVACKKKHDAPAQATASASAPSTATTEAMEALAARTAETSKLFATSPANADKLFDAVAALDGTVARDAWDPAAVVAKVGKDRAALFTWVRDNTALVPYRGALRGAVGVMMDRVGNSLDRSLLLATLLQQAGLEVRLATAQLDADATAKLAAAWENRPRPALPAEPDNPAGLDRLIASLGTDPAAVHAAEQKEAAARQDFTSRTRAQIDEETAALAKLVPGAAPARDTSALAEHWWVQIHDGDAWTDLDPATPDASPGLGLVPATDTLAVADLGDDRRHTLTIRVIGEVWHGEAREEATLVEHTFAPMDFYGQKISITTAPVDMPTRQALTGAKDPAAALKQALAAQTEWATLIRFDATPIVHFSVTDGGELFDLTDANGNATRLGRGVQKATKTGVGGATNVLDQLPDGTDQAAPQPPPPTEHSGFTAEWIEYEVRAPGAAPQTTRRVVFDAIGGIGDARKPRLLSEAERLDRGLALLGETEVLPMFARLSPGFVVDQIAKRLAALRGPLGELLALAGKAPSDELYTKLAQSPAIPTALYSLALARFEWSAAADRVYLDGLDVLTMRQALVSRDGKIRRRNLFDIVGNAVAVWPTKDSDPRLARIAQGVADTAAEALLLPCTGNGRCIHGPNTSTYFAASHMAGWKPLGTGDAAPAAARPLIADDLQAGYTVIASAAPGAPPTWWRVRADTGETLGKGLDGGDSMMETLVLQLATTIISTYYCMISASTDNGGGMCMVSAAVGLTGAILSNRLTQLRFLGYAMTIIGAVMAGEASRPADPDD